MKIGGKEYKLLFDMAAMELGIDVFGSMDEFHAAIEQREGRNLLRDTIDLVVTLGNNALEADGKAQELTHSMVAHSIGFRQLESIFGEVKKAVADGYAREMDDGSEQKPVDLFAPEDEKK